MGKVLTYGMVGGGPDAFIGQVHRKAIALDGKARIVAGCFSSSFDKTLKMGADLNINEERLYTTHQEMAEKEKQRHDKIDFIVIVTPNYAHYEACKVFLEAGFHISCDKPLTVTLEQATELEALARQKKLLFMVTYGYSGHVTVMHIKEMIASGEIGKVRMVMGEYPQAWLADQDICGNKQGEWRIDPVRAGNTNCLGDIGTHIENTVRRMTGLNIKKLLSRMEKVVPGRKLDDNSMVLIEYENGASGMYWASQIAIGHDNGLRVRIYGEKGSIFWFQEHSEIIKIIKQDGTCLELHRGHRTIHKKAAKYQRLPAGHPEGLLEAMGNLYHNFIDCIIAWKDNNFLAEMVDYPTIADGVEGIRFIEACLKSSENGNIWVRF